MNYLLKIIKPSEKVECIPSLRLFKTKLGDKVINIQKLVKGILLIDSRKMNIPMRNTLRFKTLEIIFMELILDLISTKH